MINSDYELLTKHRNTKATVNFSTLTCRKSLFNPNPLPDYDPILLKSHLNNINIERM